MSKAEPPRGAQAVTRAISLLKAFSPEQPKMSLAQLAHVIGLNKTTAHRLLAALEWDGLVARDAAEGAYRLGPAVIALGSQALLTSDLRARIRPTLERLARDSGETATFEVKVGDCMLVLDGVLGSYRIAASLDIGTQWPVHACSTGKCLMAYMSESEVNIVLSRPLQTFTNLTITNPETLREELKKIRKRGYAVAREELEPDYVAVSTALPGPMGDMEGAICLGGPASRFDENRIQKLGDMVISAASEAANRTP